MSVHILDGYYLSISFLISLAWQSVGFAIAYQLQIDTITDFWSAINVLFLSLLTLLLSDSRGSTRNLVASISVMVWSIRLGGFQLFRVRKLGGDKRFDEMRSKILSFAGFWILQLLWVWSISMPVYVLNSPSLSEGRVGDDFGNAKDVAGIVLLSIGLLCETLADVQKYRFKRAHQTNPPPRGAITDVGLWRYSRRPNYFGEILFWWGVWILCMGQVGSVQGGAKRSLQASVVSPLITMILLLLLSGVPLAEKPTQERYFLMSESGQTLEPYRPNQLETDPWKRMKTFRESTSLLVPLPNSIYRPIPGWIKRSLLLDFPFYNFDETKDGPNALKRVQDQV
ncbi:DUF1295-domain-containing protein [Violaceomyces palustris]|uniref:DUF1295-domain-containing protein n=1 Tax=Violaceomyces palustris TaxID=1673888 RepID=A0ACD0NYV8_9BASI|nr:DUF1295-domain-containing protein [Violaceomyces palustris]